MFLYKHYNLNMEIIYIGMTKNLANRHKTHFSKSHWRDEIFYIEFKKVKPENARKIEANEIQKHAPNYNIIHNNAWGYGFYKPKGDTFDKNSWIVHVENKSGVKFTALVYNRKVAAKLADLMLEVLCGRKEYFNKKIKCY